MLSVFTAILGIQVILIFGWNLPKKTEKNLSRFLNILDSNR